MAQCPVFGPNLRFLRIQHLMPNVAKTAEMGIYNIVKFHKTGFNIKTPS
jgi:hypothetical protein